MPRGKHPRKPRATEIQPGVTQEGAVITVQPGATLEMTRLSAGNAYRHPLTDPPPARACVRCAAFEPDDPGYGWCRLNPQAVRQSVTGWCMQWRQGER